MANETELNELRERIGKLDTVAQMCLLELVLADNRQRREELQTELLAADVALRNWMQSQVEVKRAAG